VSTSVHLGRSTSVHLGLISNCPVLEIIFEIVLEITWIRNVESMESMVAICVDCFR
jgi:hypothetical protein